MNRADIAVVGGGMAGASLAAALAPHASVLLLEAEEHPGYHATGRSAAFWSESYGGPGVQPLTTASGPILAAAGLLHPRGAIHLADREGEARLAAMATTFRGGTPALEALARPALEQAIPGLRQGWNHGLLEASCVDIDVAGLHALSLAAARQAGTRLVCDARVRALERRGGRWRIDTAAGTFAADILVNAAGAWADPLAVLAGVAPLGIRPYRRTIVQLRTDPPAPASLPLVIDARARFYFKPEAGGRLWLSPHDETACEPCDSAPEEADVAMAIARLEEVIDWRVERVERKWAGLRSFAPDRLPVYGHATGRNDFFWCAGQGGFGIQTAPAAALLAAALLLGRAPDPAVAGIDPAAYAPGRLIS